MITDIALEKLSFAEKARLITQAAPDTLNFEAIYADTSRHYVSPFCFAKGEPVTFRLRAGRGDNIAARVYFNEKGAWYWQALEKAAPEGLFDYYSATVGSLENTITYYFTVSPAAQRGQGDKARVYYYNAKGLSDKRDAAFDFVCVPGFSVPEWACGAVMYQIFVDRFFNGDEANDPINNEYVYLGRTARRVADWNAPVEAEDVCNFYGGDLSGVMQKLAYLKDLGVQAIYMNPIFVSPSNHKYDAQDYEHIDPHYGVIADDGGEALSLERLNNRHATKYIRRTTEAANLEASDALFAELVRMAHANGIRVIVDGVFNHCGAFHKWMDKEGFYFANGYPPGAYREQDSPYNGYFRWYDNNWPNNDCYDSWWGHLNHPKLNVGESKELYAALLSVAKKWVSPPFNADGWRLDVAADLGYSPETNHQFWRDFREAVKQANPDALIIAEQYGNAAPWLNGREWDTVMNYDAFMEPITWFLPGLEKHSESFDTRKLNNQAVFELSMRAGMARLPYPALACAMNELSNHDHSRFLTRTSLKTGRLHTRGPREADTGINKGIFKEAIVFQMTWPGAPTVYYGDEAGLTGWTDPDNRRPFPWGREDAELIEFHRGMIALRRRCPALTGGSLQYLSSEFGVLAYGRWDAASSVAVILNNNYENKLLSLPVWKINAPPHATMTKIAYADADGHAFISEPSHLTNGMLEVVMPPYSAAVYVLEASALLSLKLYQK